MAGKQVHPAAGSLVTGPAADPGDDDAEVTIILDDGRVSLKRRVTVLAGVAMMFGGIVGK